MQEGKLIDELFGPDGKLKDPWTHKQVAFVTAYIVSQNASDAARKAGYSAHTAASIGKENLHKPHISAFLAKNKVQEIARVEVSRDEVLRHHKIMAHSDIMDFLKVDAQGRPSLDLVAAKAAGKTPAIKSIEITEMPPMMVVSNGEVLQREVIKTKITLHDKPKTNADLMDHLGLLQPPTAPPPGVNNTQNNLFIMGDSPVEILKRVALLMYRGQMPAVPQPAADVSNKASGGSSGPNSLTSAPVLENGKPPQE